MYCMDSQYWIKMNIDDGDDIHAVEKWEWKQYTLIEIKWKAIKKSHVQVECIQCEMHANMLLVYELLRISLMLPLLHPLLSSLSSSRSSWLYCRQSSHIFCHQQLIRYKCVWLKDGILNDFREDIHGVYTKAYPSKNGLLQYNEFQQKFAWKF